MKLYESADSMIEAIQGASEKEKTACIKVLVKFSFKDSSLTEAVDKQGMAGDVLMSLMAQIISSMGKH